VTPRASGTAGTINERHGAECEKGTLGMIKSQDREDRRGRRTMYHGATRNGASVQLDDGRLIETAGKGELPTPATMMAECGSATRPCKDLQCDSAGLHAGVEGRVHGAVVLKAVN
jgi:hypothetical protein